MWRQRFSAFFRSRTNFVAEGQGLDLHVEDEEIRRAAPMSSSLARSPSKGAAPSTLDAILSRLTLLPLVTFSSRWLLFHFSTGLLVAWELHTPRLLTLLTAKPSLLATGFLLVLLLLCAMNTLYALAMFFRPVAPIPVTREQARLLNIRPDQPGFKIQDQRAATPASPAPRYPNPFQPPLCGSFLGTPVASSPALSVSATASPLVDMSSSWVYQSPGGASPEVAASPSSPAAAAATSPRLPPRFHSNQTSPITDEGALEDYLQDYDAWEQSHVSPPAAAAPSPLDAAEASFWSPSRASRASHSDSVLQQLYYALSTGPLPPSVSSRDADGGTGGATPTDASGHASPSPGSHDLRRASLLCYRVGIDPLELVSWMQNLRMWISQTILVRLVQEIDETNAQLAKIGLSDALIGQTGLEKVKNCHPQVLQSLPSLPNLLPFLELSVHQDYLVQRLRDLSTGGAMSEFRWKGGGRHRGQDWTDKLPTDAELVMHCVACYLDSRLPPVKGVVDGSVFSSLYFRKLPERPPLPVASSASARSAASAESKSAAEARAALATTASIVQTAQRPPHYVLQLDSGAKMELVPGRNNLFHTLLLFLHHVKTKENGMLGRVNLGRSGINILWVIE